MKFRSRELAYLSLWISMKKMWGVAENCCRGDIIMSGPLLHVTNLPWHSLTLGYKLHCVQLWWSCVAQLSLNTKWALSFILLEPLNSWRWGTIFPCNVGIQLPIDAAAYLRTESSAIPLHKPHNLQNKPHNNLVWSFHDDLSVTKWWKKIIKYITFVNTLLFLVTL
jgi:hypothetical protein